MVEYREYLIDQDQLEVFFWEQPCNHYLEKVSESLDLFRSEDSNAIVGFRVRNLKPLILKEFLEQQLWRLR